MVKKKPLLTRGTALALTFAIAIAGLVPAVMVGSAKAAIVSDRKITISDSAPDATNVTYNVSFKLGSTHANLEGVVVEFCEETPIIGDTTCTAPTAFSIGTSPVIDNFSVAGGAEITTWTVGDLADNARTLIVSDSTGVAGAIGDIVTFDITGVHNPSTTNHSFYARIYTWTDSAGATGYTLANPDAGPGSHLDDGGIAMSTANTMLITAKVQERLTFCVYSNSDCASGGNSIILGDANGVLDPDHDYTNISAKFDIGTNALSGAVVTMKGDTLESGARSITAMGDTAIAAVHGSEQFGMCLVGGTGVTPTAPYNDAGCTGVTAGIDHDAGANFAFDTTSTTGVAGDQLASKVPGVVSSSTMAFLGNIAWATEAGIYTTTLTFIATGTY